MSKSGQRGIKKEDVVTLVGQFMEQGLKGIDLEHSRGKRSGKLESRRASTIEKTAGIRGGAARVAGTRIPVWQFVEARDPGVSEAQLLIDYPRLKAVNLADAWAYADNHPGEIATEI